MSRKPAKGKSKRRHPSPLATQQAKASPADGAPQKDSPTPAARSEVASNSDDTASASAPPMALLGGLLALFFAAIAWAYASRLVEIESTWSREPDYSHGYLIVPLAIGFLIARYRTSTPIWGRPAWLSGFALMGIGVLGRIVSAVYFIDAVDDWSLIPTLAGLVLLLGGWRMFRWSWPAILFLFFAIPLPFKAERMMSLPLQAVATKLSCWTLQLLGQPAIAEGNTIFLTGVQLEVEQACSGLRIFVAISALAFAFVVLRSLAWWERAILLAATLPVALIANAIRIVTTGLLFQFASSDAAHKFSHDFAGWLMIPIACALFFLCGWYLRLLVPVVYKLDVRDTLRT